MKRARRLPPKFAAMVNEAPIIYRNCDKDWRFAYHADTTRAWRRKPD